MSNTHTTEFEVAFQSYVRVDAEGGCVDTRDAMARKLVERGAEELLRFKMAPHDLAAIFSGSVGLQHLASLAQVKELKGRALKGKLKSLAERGLLPLAVRAEHPVGTLFTSLLETKNGCELYRDIAILLSWAAEAPGIRVHIYRSTDGETVVDRSQSEPHPEEEIEESLTPEVEDDEIPEREED